MTIKNKLSIKKYRKNDIFEFNHIDKNLSPEKVKEIMDLYKYYHKKNWTYKSNYSRKKKINLLMNLLSLTLASVGVITGGITLNPIVLGVLTTAGILLKSYMEAKNYKGKLDMIKFGVTTYEKIFINLRSALRGSEFDHKKFITEIKMLDSEIVDLTPSPSSKIDKKYNKKFNE